MDPSPTFETTNSLLLANLFISDESPDVFWKPDDFPQIFRHQLLGPIGACVPLSGQVAAERLEKLGSEATPPITNIRELLFHPNPPLELLSLVKGFAKACRTNKQGVLPEPVAAALYFLTTAAGLVHAAVRLSSLDDVKLAKALTWTAQQSFVDQELQALAMEANRGLASKG